MTRIVIAMSGGVDSSLAAALLVEAGYDVIGVAMRLWEDAANPDASGCCSLDDFLDARQVAAQLGIPFYVMDFRDDFRRAVVDDFVAQYRTGRTPNPCARCNQWVKFGTFWDRARALGAEKIATGHYARVREGVAGAELWRGADEEKDQSYFLFSIDPAVLAHTLFPVGGMTKAEVRREAERRGLPVAHKRDSQEVCFAPGREHAPFVERQASAVPLRGGTIVDEEGRVLGQHAGIHRFTIGQRRGLGVATTGAPLYVTAIDGESGTVRVGPAERVVSSGLTGVDACWLNAAPRVGDWVGLKIRSRFAAQPARVVEVGASTFRVAASGGLRAVTPGQAAVLYDGDRVLGGGWIAGAVEDVDAPRQAAAQQGIQ
jgi:tRNA-specific 2-thiouridylase